MPSRYARCRLACIREHAHIRDDRKFHTRSRGRRASLRHGGDGGLLTGNQTRLVEAPIASTIVSVLKVLRPFKEREGPKRAWKRLLSMARKQEDLFEAIADAL
mmetsp:Transcript_101906/g.273584  ORF Transcript_101906/g.273584 Transcript_101906/m.273584 type:complete len:103 (-) Transcript_101906:54-362(-)